jgi:hypothetical protein
VKYDSSYGARRRLFFGEGFLISHFAKILFPAKAKNNKIKASEAISLLYNFMEIH